MRAAMYLRKSRADDPHEAITATLQRHESILRQLAQQENIVITAVYREVVSGDRLDARLQMRRLLEDCDKDLFDGVLCMDIDRLGRGSMAEQGLILDTFKTAHIRLITPRKTYDLNNDLDETYSEFESFMARQELKMIKRRLRRGVRRSAQEGGFLSSPPYGYQRAIREKHPSLSPLPVEAEAVRLIFEWYAHGGLGCQQIADRLNEMGYLPRRAAAFGRTSVLEILSNPVYCGRIVRRDAQGETLDIVGLHPPIVSAALFEQAAFIRRTRAHPPIDRRTLQNPLAGLVVCGYCGSKMQRLPANKTRRQESLCCPCTGCNVASRLSLVEERIAAAVLERLPRNVPAPTQPTQIDHTAARQQQLDEQKMRLYQLIEQGVYTPQEYIERRAALERQHTALSTANATHDKRASVTVTDAESYTRADATVRNTFLRSYIEKVTYKKEFGWKPNVFELTIIWKNNRPHQ